MPITVPGHGPLNCKIAFVSEHPGKDEILHQKPFVGGSGKLLNEMCSRAGIRRSLYEQYFSGVGYKVEVFSEAYVTNIYKHGIPPVGGDFGKSFYTNQKRKTPTDELKGYYEELKAELEPCTANVIVAAGEHALVALTGKKGISNYRGSILESTLLPGRKVIPIIHPARVLREWYYRSLTISDLKRVRKQSEFPEIRRPERLYVIEPSLYEVEEIIEAMLREAQKISFDIETKGTHISCIGFSHSPAFALCVPFMRGIRNYWSDSEERQIWKLVARLLGSPIPKIAQNAQFDMSYMATHGCPVKNIWWDTMIAQGILYPEIEKSLAVMTSIFTEEPYYKEEGRKVMGIKSEKAWVAGQADQQLWIYNSRDAAITTEIQEAQEKEFIDVGAERRFG